MFIRHAEAEEAGRGVSGADEKRALTPLGWKQARTVADALEYLKLRPQLVLTSPLVRAQQTAEAMCERLKNAPQPVLTKTLAPGGTWRQLRVQIARRASRLEKRGKKRTPIVFVVGHQPDLSFMVLEAVAGAARGFKLLKGACVGVEWEGPSMQGTPAIWFAMDPRLAKRLKK
jgi:phosphohistidine phosphatase